MFPLPSRFSQKGQFSLSALLLVSCMLLLISGPFFAALAMLRADSGYAMGRSFTHYRAHATHLVRGEYQPGDGTLVFEDREFPYAWTVTDFGHGQTHFICVKPYAEQEWQARISMWLNTATFEIEIRGTNSPI